MTQYDIRRGTSGVSLPAAVSSEIWTNVLESSAVMKVARRIDLPGSGVSVPIISGEATADWVTETSEKPVSRPTINNKTITPYKLALIVPFSNEFRRDLGSLYAAMVRQLPLAIGKKFDETVFNGTSPGSGFDVLTSCATQAMGSGTTTYTNLISAIGTVVSGGGDVTDWVLSNQAEMRLLGAVDGDSRPLYVPSNTADGRGSVTNLVGRPVTMSRHVYDDSPNTYGIAGDFANSAVWGQVSDISVAISDQATINDSGTLLHLFQRNMFAVRVEVEVGFAYKDLDHFVRLTSA